MNDSNSGGTKDAGNVELKGLPARVIPDEPAQTSTRPTLRVLSAGPTPQPTAPVGDQWEPSPFNKRIAETRRDVANCEDEIDVALRDRGEARAKGDALIATMKDSGRTRAGEHKLEKLRNQYDGAVERQLEAEKQRLKSKARLGALLVVREHRLLEREARFMFKGEVVTLEQLRELLASRDNR